MTGPDVSDYRLPPILVARIVGGALVLLALLLLATTLVVAAAGWSPDVILVAVLVGALGLVGLVWWLRTRAYVVRFDVEGYRVGLVRGAGVRAAPWSAVSDAATTTLHGVPLVVLTLRDARTTVVPVTVLEGDREELVRELQRRLQAGHRLRPLPTDAHPEPGTEPGESTDS